ALPMTNGAPELVTLNDGTVLVTGYWSPTIHADEVYVYDPQADAWSQTRSFFYPRFFAPLVKLADGRVLATGGSSPTSLVVGSAEIYAPNALPLGGACTTSVQCDSGVCAD